MSDNDAGLSIIYTGGYVSDLAICIDPTDRFYGWLLAKNPLDGQWVSLAKMDANATNLHEAREKIATLERELEEARAGVARRYIDGDAHDRLRGVPRAVSTRAGSHRRAATARRNTGEIRAMKQQRGTRGEGATDRGPDAGGGDVSANHGRGIGGTGMSTPQTTHWDGCATDGGPAHYECAVGRIRELEAELARVRDDRDALHAEFDGTRAELARAEAARAEAERDALRAVVREFVWIADEGDKLAYERLYGNPLTEEHKQRTLDFRQRRLELAREARRIDAARAQEKK